MTNDMNFFELINACTNESINLVNRDSAEVQGIITGYLACKDNKGKRHAVMIKNCIICPYVRRKLIVCEEISGKRSSGKVYRKNV